MNIKDNAAKVGNGILDISPRNVAKAIVSPFTYLNRKKNEHVEKATKKANDALAVVMASAMTNAMAAAQQSNRQEPTVADFTVVEKEQNDSNKTEPASS